MGPAAVRHGVQPGQLHAFSEIALCDHRLHLLAKQDLVRTGGDPSPTLHTDS